MRHAETRQWGGAILRGGPGPRAEWAAGRRSSPAAARPPSLGRRRSADAREPPPALPAAPPRSARASPPPPPPPASGLVPAAFSLLVEEKKNNNSSGSGSPVLLREPPRPPRDKTRHEPGLALLRAGPRAQPAAGSLVETAPRARRDAPGPRPPPPAPRRPLPREPAEHASAHGVARRGQVSACPAARPRAAPAFPSGPGPGRGVGGVGRSPPPLTSPHTRPGSAPRRPVCSRARPRTRGAGGAPGPVPPGGPARPVRSAAAPRARLAARPCSRWTCLRLNRFVRLNYRPAWGQERKSRAGTALLCVRVSACEDVCGSGELGEHFTLKSHLHVRGSSLFVFPDSRSALCVIATLRNQKPLAAERGFFGGCVSSALGGRAAPIFMFLFFIFFVRSWKDEKS